MSSHGPLERLDPSAPRSPASRRRVPAGAVDAVYSFTSAYFEALAGAGVEHVVISPGSRSTPLTLSAARSAALRCWTLIDERSAGFFALGLARVSRRPVALVCTSGSAAANYWPAVVEARHDHVPLILLTADRPPELRGWGAGQTIDQLRLYGEYARWLGDMPVAGEAGATTEVARAWALRSVADAQRRPARPVHLNWPFREPLEPDGLVVAGPADGGPRFVDEPQVPAPAPDVVADLTDWIREHPRGLVACGPLDADDDLAHAIADLARAAGWPIWADPLSGVRCGEHVATATVLEAGDLWARDGRFASTVAPDAVLRFGALPTSKAFRRWLGGCAPEAVVQVDADGDWADPDRASHRWLPCDALALCRAAVRRLGGADGSRDVGASAWPEAVRCADRAASRSARAALDATPWSEPVAVRCAVEAMPADSNVWVASSMPVRDLDAWLPTSERRLRILGNRGANGIDGTISSALGAAVGSERPTLLLCGDLAFLHDLGGLLGVARFDAPLVIVVLDNDGGGIFSMLPIAGAIGADEFERLFRTPHGLDLGRAAALFGLALSEVGDVDELVRAVEEGVASNRPKLVIARVDADESWSARRRAWDAAGAAARAAFAAAPLEESSG